MIVYGLTNGFKYNMQAWSSCIAVQFHSSTRESTGCWRMRLGAGMTSTGSCLNLRGTTKLWLAEDNDTIDPFKHGVIFHSLGCIRTACHLSLLETCFWIQTKNLLLKSASPSKQVPGSGKITFIEVTFNKYPNTLDICWTGSGGQKSLLCVLFFRASHIFLQRDRGHVSATCFIQHPTHCNSRWHTWLPSFFALA